MNTTTVISIPILRKKPTLPLEGLIRLGYYEDSLKLLFHDGTEIDILKEIEELKAVADVIAYDWDISGDRDGVNTAFSLANTYTEGTLKVFVNGVRQTIGADNDYVENGDNSFSLHIAPEEDDTLLVDYKMILEK